MNITLPMKCLKCENKTFYIDATGEQHDNILGLAKIKIVCTKCGWSKTIKPEQHQFTFLDVYQKRSDIKYYRMQDAKTSEAYKLGRQHEYRAMATLRKQGFHCNRRFGSKGIWYCSKCMRHVAINRKFCRHCNTNEYVVSASLDVTAFKEIRNLPESISDYFTEPLGIYVFITCKWSAKGTVPYDDSTWRNLVKYADYYGGIPVFCGVTQEGKLYFIDLRTMKEFDIEKR